MLTEKNDGVGAYALDEDLIFPSFPFANNTQLLTLQIFIYSFFVMKKVLLWLVIWVFSLGSVLAYTPTASDAALVEVIVKKMAVLDDAQTTQVAWILTSATQRFDADSKKWWYARLLLRLANEQLGIVSTTTTTTTNPSSDLIAELSGKAADAEVDNLEEDSEEKTNPSMNLVLPTISVGDFDLLKKHVAADLIWNEIVLVEFTDLQCWFCQRFHKAGTLDQVVSDNPWVVDASLAFPLSFHPLAHGAAQALECVKTNISESAAITFKDVIIETWLKQESDITESFQKLWVNQIVVDDLGKCYDDGVMMDVVDEQFELGKRLGVTGTPATIALHIPTMQYFKISGAVDASRVQEVVDKMLEDDREYFDIKKPSPTNPGAWWAVRWAGFVVADENDYADFLSWAVIEGKEDAQYTLIEFSDFACPFCQRHFTNGTIEEVREKYSDDVNTIFAHFPLSFHTHAQAAWEALECAKEIGGEVGYLNFKEALFLIWGNADAAKVEQAAIDANISADALISCVDSGRYEQLVKDQMSFGRSLGITWTPGNIILDNETLKALKISGAVPAWTFTSTLEKLIDGSFVYGTSPTPTAPAQAELKQEDYNDFLNSAVIRWNPNAKISIIEFSDLACPFCQRHANEWTLDAVHEKYGDDVNIIFAHYPLDFHPHAETAAQAIECANDLAWETGYFAFKKAFFELGGNARPELAQEAAESVWIDAEALATCVESSKFEQKVIDDKAFGGMLWVRGTPGNLVVNNETLDYSRISGAVGANAFDARIEEFLE